MQQGKAQPRLVTTTGAAEPYKAGEILTFSGRRVRPTELEPRDIDPGDIAHALSNQCRFTGHCKRYYSVAQHCVHVSLELLGPVNVTSPTSERGLMLAGLLHDATEAYLMDLASPIKALPEFAPFKAIEKKIAAAIEARFGLHPGALSDARVKTVDRRLLATEARDLMRGAFNLDTAIEPYRWEVTPWSPERAREAWLNQFYALGGC
jgi:uncharacterized protein